MPYRRLPNTDQARLKALKAALRKSKSTSFNDQFLNFKIVNEADCFLPIFETQLNKYHQTFETKVSSNKRYRTIVSNARMYISHFIQVLNLSVIRGDIKKEQKLLYKLDRDTHTLPDLSTDDALLEWGRNIIDGENKRLSTGGFAIYNPTIAKVQVHYNIFKEYQATQKIHKASASRDWEEVDAMRAKADEIILELWNQIEEQFKMLKPYERLCRCQEYGVIYYYRTGEAKLTPQTDQEIERAEAQSPTIPLFDQE